MNTYSNLTIVKDNLGIDVTDFDAILLRKLKWASRRIDAICHRHFYVHSDSRVFDSEYRGHLFIDDILSITSLKIDNEQDGNFDDETWTQGTDFILWPYNTYPKTEVLVTTFGNYDFPCLQRSVQIVGLFGYGNGVDQNPVLDTGATTSGSWTASGLTLAVDDGTLLNVGDTILVDSEQLFISSISSNNITVEKRGINGTTGATHIDGTTIYRYTYPDDVMDLCAIMAGSAYARPDAGDLQSERLGDYSYSRMADSGVRATKQEQRILAPYIKEEVH